MDKTYWTQLVIKWKEINYDGKEKNIVGRRP